MKTLFRFYNHLKMDDHTNLNFSYTQKAKYNTKDLILYALSINCEEKKYTYEGDAEFQAFPTFISALLFKGESQDVQSFPPPSFINPLPLKFLKAEKDAKIDSNLVVIHVQQDFTFYRKIPVPHVLGKSSVRIIMEQTIVKVHPKRVGIFVTAVTEYWLAHPDDGTQRIGLCAKGQALYLVKGIAHEKVHNYNATFSSLRPDKGVNLDKVQKVMMEKLTVPIKKEQALLYRIGSGDYNVIHVLNKNGYGDEPILHGLCSLGLVVNAILIYFEKKNYGLTGDLTDISIKFSSPVLLSSSSLEVVWSVANFDGHDSVIEFKAYQNRKLVMDGGRIELGNLDAFDESIPQSKL